MSDTTSTTDGKPPSDTPSSSVATPTDAPAPSAPDSSTPSSGTDSKAPSSGDSRQSDRDGLLAAVLKVVETKADTAIPSDGETTADADADRDQAARDQAAASGTEGTKPPDTPASQTTPPSAETEADPTEAELKKLRPETRRRFERLLAQRNEARQGIEALQPELTQHRRLQGYLQQNQLAPEDVNTLLGVGAALRRGDYKGFLDGVTPFVMAAQEALGLRVAPDLVKQVNEGTIDEAAARELTRTRHRAAQAEARLKDANQTVVNTQQTQQRDGIRTAVDTWEAGIRQRDPDYAQMSDAVRRAAQGLIRERGEPTDRQQAVALVQAAYDEVRSVLARVRPAPRATRATPSSIHVATGTPTAEPRTMKDAVLNALSGMRRAS
jgi:hypothetical protein